MNCKLISTHLRVMNESTQVVGLYLSTDDTGGTPFFVANDVDKERIWISKESAAEMIREDDAVMAAGVPIQIIIDLLDEGK